MKRRLKRNSCSPWSSYKRSSYSLLSAMNRMSNKLMIHICKFQCPNNYKSTFLRIMICCDEVRFKDPVPRAEANTLRCLINGHARLLILGLFSTLDTLNRTSPFIFFGWKVHSPCLLGSPHLKTFHKIKEI